MPAWDDPGRLRSKTRYDPTFEGNEFVSMRSTFDVGVRWNPPAHDWPSPSCAECISAKVVGSILRRLLRASYWFAEHIPWFNAGSLYVPTPRYARAVAPVAACPPADR